MSVPLLELDGIVKRFGSVTALDDAALRVERGSVHALLGENGAGKTTLMRIAYGLERPDAGTIRIGGETITLRGARDALSRGVVMVQQHFALVPAMTVAENVALGASTRYDPRETVSRLEALGRDTSLHVDPHARVADLPPAAQQKVELLKALFRGARVLILDEPTAVLAPTEVRELKAFLGRIAAEGVAVVLITHKLHDALDVADRVTVLRAGRVAFAGPRASLGADDVAAAMFPAGAPPPPARTMQHQTGAVVAALRGVRVTDDAGVDRLSDATLDIRRGEIVGVAGVEGSGYHELLLVLAGRRTPDAGTVEAPHTVGFIPEHRQRDALIGQFSLVENVALHNVGRARGRVRWTDLRDHTRGLLEQYDVRADGARATARSLSGGNQQKLVLARELAESPALIVAENPTQGLDARAAAAIRARLGEARERGAGIVMYSSDLDELVAVADRVVVTFEGRIHPAAREVDAMGRAMLGA